MRNLILAAALVAGAVSAQATVKYHGATNDPGMMVLANPRGFVNPMWHLRMFRDEKKSISIRQGSGYAFMFASPTYSGVLKNVLQLDVPVFCWWEVDNPPGGSTWIDGWNPPVWWGQAKLFAQAFFWNSKGLWFSRVAEITTPK